MRKLLLTLLLVVSLTSSVFAQIPPGGGGSSTPAVGDITGLGTGVATWLATPSCVNFAAAVTGETGTGACVFNNAPTFIAPVLGVATATSIGLNATAPATAGKMLANPASGFSADAVVYGIGDAGRGLYSGSATSVALAANMLSLLQVDGNSLSAAIPADAAFAWVSGNATTTINSGTIDSMVFRKGAGIIGAGTTAIGTTDGFFQGKYNASDGTAGLNATCTIAGLLNIVVKFGIITACN